jgi:hypothetical protein
LTAAAVRLETEEGGLCFTGEDAAAVERDFPEHHKGKSKIKMKMKCTE